MLALALDYAIELKVNFSFCGLLSLIVCRGLRQWNVSRVDVTSVVVACIEGHSTPNISFEVHNNKNKYAPEEGLKKLYILEPDEPRDNDTQVTGMLLR